jgi:hypothetical protein
MKESYLPTLLQMRLLIGFLGERAQYDWWPTAFHAASSRLFLEPVFSKTSRLAQYHGVLEAARRLHDEHLSVGSYHLFRLPEEIEQDLHAAMQNSAGEELIGQMPKSKEAALDGLKRLAATGGISNVGPMAVGSIKDIDSTDTLKVIAAAYLSAFTQNAKTYPYLVGGSWAKTQHPTRLSCRQASVSSMRPRRCSSCGRQACRQTSCTRWHWNRGDSRP